MAKTVKPTEKYTRKASARIIKEILKFKPKVPGNTTFDQAFTILMEEWDLEMSIKRKYTGETICQLYRDEETVKEWVYENDSAWIEKDGDWDWNIIFKDVLEDIIKLKLYKRPKLGKRAQKKQDEKIAKLKEERIKAAEFEAKANDKVPFEVLKQKRNQLSSKITNWKKAKRDPIEIAELQKQLNEVKLQIKNY
jgi:hypothetical protein